MSREGSLPRRARAGLNRLTLARPNIALQLTSGGLAVARFRARRHRIGPLAAERGRWAARLGPLFRTAHRSPKPTVSFDLTTSGALTDFIGRAPIPVRKWR